MGITYLIKTKDEVFGKFKEFKVEVENLTNKKIKTLRSNNGEYTSKELITFGKADGIRRELILPQSSIEWCGKKKEPFH
jgi:hypothetical protein